MQNYSYPTNLTDEQWEIIEPLLPARKKLGRPAADRRGIIDALLYGARAGGAWRLLPKDFAPWQTVYGYFWRWSDAGLWDLINETLRTFARRAVGKRSQPTAAILDSQTVRAADHPGLKGYDAAKRTKGRKRHILVDTLGLLLAVCVGPADVAERAGARSLLGKALGRLPWLRCIWADQGYEGPDFAAWVRSHRKTGSLRLEVVRRDPGQKGFSALPRRWIVERTFGWFMKHRRLVRDYETKERSAEAWIHIAMMGVMLRRLA
jgi:putative transposase